MLWPLPAAGRVDWRLKLCNCPIIGTPSCPPQMAAAVMFLGQSVPVNGRKGINLSTSPASWSWELCFDRGYAERKGYSSVRSVGDIDVPGRDLWWWKWERILGCDFEWNNRASWVLTSGHFLVDCFFLSYSVDVLILYHRLLQKLEHFYTFGNVGTTEIYMIYYENYIVKHVFHFKSV